MKNDVHPDDPLHIERCATCREQMMNSSDFARSVADVEQSIAAGPESGHLDYETELAPYVDGQLGGAERDIVERHLASCNQCAAEARDLREFRSVLENESRFSKRLLPWLAAAAALLVLIGIGWWRELPGRREQVQKEIPRQETSPRSPALVALHDESRTIVLQSDIDSIAARAEERFLSAPEFGAGRNFERAISQRFGHQLFRVAVGDG